MKDVKYKDSQVYSLLEQNRELKKINSCEKLDEIYSLKSKLNEVTGHLETRDEDYRVSLSYFKVFSELMFTV